MVDNQIAMDNFKTASVSNEFVSQPHLDAALAANISANVTQPESAQPMEILAASPYWDTEFRKKIGIMRWGLND